MKDRLMLLPSQEVLTFFPQYRSTQVAWQGLTPAACWLIRTLRPGCLVELGSYRGDSFFSFLQAAATEPAVKALWAVDSWSGDQHTGPFDDRVAAQFHAELTRRNDPRAHMLRKFFSDAAADFVPRSIDLLHIDGAHDYDSVRTDYEVWRPLMAPGGVVLFHDTMVRGGGFGVWKLWAEIEAAHPGRCLNLPHSNGLGILCLPGGGETELTQLCAAAPTTVGMFCEALRLAGQRVVDTTIYESRFITRHGGICPTDHVFARGDDLGAVRTLMQADFDAMTTRGDGRTGNEAQESGAVPGSTAPDRLGHHAGRLAEILDQRIERLVTDQKGDLFAALAPEIASRLESRIERLVTDQKGDLFAALAPAVGHAIENALGPPLADLRAGLGGLRADLDRHRQLSLLKNDAQDDAILGIAAKIEAQDQVIQGLQGYLQDIFHHPLFR